MFCFRHAMYPYQIDSDLASLNALYCSQIEHFSLCFSSLFQKYTADVSSRLLFSIYPLLLANLWQWKLFETVFFFETFLSSLRTTFLKVLAHLHQCCLAFLAPTQTRTAYYSTHHSSLLDAIHAIGKSPKILNFFIFIQRRRRCFFQKLFSLAWQRARTTKHFSQK